MNLEISFYYLLFLEIFYVILIIRQLNFSFFLFIIIYILRITTNILGWIGKYLGNRIK